MVFGLLTNPFKSEPLFYEIDCMRIGLIADIHSNLPALTAVLEQMGTVDMLVCAGDMVGYYNQPNDICDLIRERAAAVVFGNHEAYVTGLWKPDSVYEPILRAVWTRDNLSPTNLDWLTDLPEECIINADSYTLRIRHTWKGGVISMKTHL
jgi:predicted phosphodiesterase